MRAISYTEPGGPDVLQLVDRPVPEPGPGEVRVRVAFSGVNPTDWKSRSNADPGPDGKIPNQDGAGTIEAVGQGVDPVLVGERVWIWEAAYAAPVRDGGRVHRRPRPADRAARRGPSFELGAALGVPFLTAHRCLTVAESLPDRLGPGSLDGRTVLVQGGAGAVGNAAIQLARWADATVIATVSSPDEGPAGRRGRRRPRRQLPAAGRRRRGPQDRAEGRRRDRRGDPRPSTRRPTPRSSACTAPSPCTPTTAAPRSPSRSGLR